MRAEKETIYDVAIAGAGASGLMAAIMAARAGARTVLLEHMEQPAKKILATGNGKCNYTNAVIDTASYYCADTCFLEQVLGQFPYEATVSFFEQLGVRPLKKNGTCIYPESEQALAVRSALLAETERLGITLLAPVGIRSIRKDRKLFVFDLKDTLCRSKTCILATGGKSAKKTGSDGSGYIYAKQLGHKLAPPVPALVPLLTDASKWKLPAGVRIACRAALLIEEKEAACERGELQITDTGISGIVIFQFSRLAARALQNGKRVEVVLDFKPDMTDGELRAYIFERCKSIFHAKKTLAACLLGFLPDKLIPAVCAYSGLDCQKPCATYKKEQLARLVAVMKHYKVTVTGTKGFDFSQVTAGGVLCAQICPQTMESTRVGGLYFAGELVDVDAKCGGFNLQWAWASGYTAGVHAAAYSRTKTV